MQKQIDKYGLIGKDISYSFSKKFFTQKFINEGLNNCSYENYDISSIQLEFPYDGIRSSIEEINSFTVIFLNVLDNFFKIHLNIDLLKND